VSAGLNSACVFSFGKGFRKQNLPNKTYNDQPVPQKRRHAMGEKGSKKDKNKADKQKQEQNKKKEDQQKAKLPAKKPA
jgi:hypothetical protein